MINWYCLDTKILWTEGDSVGSFDHLTELSKNVYTDLAQPAVKQVSKTIELPFRAINVALSPIEKWLVHKEYSLEETKKILAKKLENIPEEKIVTPEPYIAVPALQAISYCMDCEDLRELFANLLSTAMNIDTKDNTHPAFVEIIKQLNPIDAQILKTTNIKETKNYPVCSVRIQENSTSVDIVGLNAPKHQFRNMANGFYHLKNFAIIDHLDFYKVSASLDNIERLGIIDIDYNYHLIDTNFYLPFANHPFLLSLEQELEQKKQKIKDFENREVALLRGTIKLTDFGTTLCIAIL